jgi:putative GTP pyrophosphokinase
MNGISSAEAKRIDKMVEHYLANREKFDTILYQLSGYVSTSQILGRYVHSTRQRTKDPEHLRAKLVRKLLGSKSSTEPFAVCKNNLFKQINDLAGFRIIHLHSRQVKDIHAELISIFDEQRWILIEGPVAKTWDDESRRYFTEMGWKTEVSESMYTSVHYVVQPNSKSELTCELQVRTLMEEVWGEVDHTINYPIKSSSQSCREQIKVLARLTSSCSRLVDSIFLANLESVPSAAKSPLKKRASGVKNSAKPKIPPA